MISVTLEVWVEALFRMKLAGAAVLSQFRTWAVVLPMAIPVSEAPDVPLSVVTAVFVAGSWMMQPEVAMPVGTVIVLSPDWRTTCWTWPLAAALVSVMGPTEREPVGVLLIVPAMVMLAVAAMD